MPHDPQAFARLRELDLDRETTDSAHFTTDAGPLRVTWLEGGTVRLQLGTHAGPDYGMLSALPPAQTIRTEPTETGFRVHSDSGTLELSPDPLRLRIETIAGRAVESIRDQHFRGWTRLPAFGHDGERWQASFALETGEPVYGLGNPFGPLNHRGQQITSWNEDALGVNTDATYCNVPFAWSPRGWGVLAHTPARVHHGVGYPPWSNRSYVVQVEDPVLDLFLLQGATPAQLIAQLTRLTGRPPMLPSWSFGTWMTLFQTEGAEDVLRFARSLREREIPCDVLLLDGRAWLDLDTRFDFQWDASRFPDPTGLLAELHALNFRVCLWEYPYVSVHNPLFEELAERGFLLTTDDGAPYVYEWDPEPFGGPLTPLPASGMVDFTNPDAYAWFRDAHRPLFEQGVDAMKTDYGEQIPEDVRAHNGERGARLHNVYSLLYNQCVFEAGQRYGQGPTVIWSRSGWTGSQRYPVHWGGDPQSDWEGLAASIRGGLHWGLSGGTFYSHDIGGFYGDRPDAELYVRWAQAGLMGSHARFHGIGPREPWAFGEEAERIVRDWIRWRYRLLPYLAACALAAHEHALPVMRAMPLAFPDDPPSATFEEQYLLGPSLLVMPVLAPGGRVRGYLPPGAWHELHTGTRVLGPKYVDTTVPLDQIPMFGREGHMIPLGPSVAHTEALPADPAITEVRTFGVPTTGLRAARFALSVQSDGKAGTRLRGVPSDAELRVWGPARAEREADGTWRVLPRPESDPSPE